MGAVSVLPAFPAVARSPGFWGRVTVGAGSDVGAGLAEVRDRGSVPQPPAELGTLGSQPQARVLYTLPGQHTSHRGWGRDGGKWFSFYIYSVGAQVGAATGPQLVTLTVPLSR